MKRSLFEGRQSGRNGAGALRCKHHRFPFIFHRIHKGQHCFDGILGVGTVYENGASVLQYFAQYGCFGFDFLFANASDIAAQQFGNNHYIGFALVIKNEDRRAM